LPPSAVAKALLMVRESIPVGEGSRKKVQVNDVDVNPDPGEQVFEPEGSIDNGVIE
jgi:hypothetical protein